MKKMVILTCISLIIAMALMAGFSRFQGGMLQTAAVCAAEQALKVFINDSPSSVKPVDEKGTLFVPLNFPVEQGKTSWTVTVDYDKASGTVKIQKGQVKQKLRGDTKCNRCSGSGKCQACYPAGSGKNINDGACNACDGNGKCFYCDGKGDY